MFKVAIARHVRTCTLLWSNSTLTIIIWISKYAYLRRMSPTLTFVFRKASPMNINEHISQQVILHTT